MALHVAISENQQYTEGLVDNAARLAMPWQKQDLQPSLLMTIVNALPLLIFGITYYFVALLQECCAHRSMGSECAEAVPLGIPVVHTHETPYVTMENTDGRWSDGLLSCCNDFKILVASCCCPCVAIGQLYERVHRQRHACFAIVALFCTAQLLASVRAPLVPLPSLARSCPRSPSHLSLSLSLSLTRSPPCLRAPATVLPSCQNKNAVLGRDPDTCV